MTPVPPLPAASGVKVPDVLMLVPDHPGGIRSLFEQLQHAPGAPSRTQLRFFDSDDSRPAAITRLPWRLLKFIQTLRGGDFALCHINLSGRGSTLRKLCYAALCRWHGVPYVIHLHGSGYDAFFACQPVLVKAIIRRLFQRAARVIVLGQVWREFAVQQIGVPTERVVILPNAVKGPDAAMVNVAVATPRLLFLGRLGSRKGVPDLLNALATEALAALRWTATIAGDGDVALYRQRAAALGLATRVTFPGWVSGEQVATLLQQSDILALPSHAENLPLSLLEGMAHGLCPVVTPVGAVEDVIRDGENGVLVPVGDVGALAAALASVCADAALRQRLASQARADFLAHYDIRDYRVRLEAIYLDVLQ